MFKAALPDVQVRRVSRGLRDTVGRMPSSLAVRLRVCLPVPGKGGAASAMPGCAALRSCATRFTSRTRHVSQILFGYPRAPSLKGTVTKRPLLWQTLPAIRNGVAA
jgi:hypothetical protein